MSSKKKARPADSDSDSGPDDRTPASKKPKTKETASKASAGDGDEDNTFSIGKKRFVTVRQFKGKVMVDIREFYEDNNADLKPGRKGICLQLDQWNALKGRIEEIDEAIRKF
ncbi:activated RNA polymerase II transcriptional coactivator p15-like [Ornithodoros turicata]|uniref:Activated RNA polymerase II transcriptional coactivator p15 n=1 Tax=Ornithodoros turicata TaxID=34597 RepID=A0A2R5L5B3_9ACAR